MVEQRGNVSVFINILIYVLIALGVLIVLGSVAFGVLTIMSAPTAATTTSTAPPSIVTAFVMIFTGGLLGLLCFSTAAVLSLLVGQSRQSQALRDSIDQLRAGFQSLDVAIRIPPAPGNALARPAASPKPVATEEGSQPLLLDLLEQVRDAALMNDSQRQQLATIHWARRKQTLTESIERHMLGGNWAAARAQLSELQALLPADAEIRELAERADGEYSARLAEDMKAAEPQCRNLVGNKAWADSNALVAALENKYPGAREVDALRRFVVQEHEKFEREQKEKILAEVADAGNKKQWKRAVSAIEEYIAKYPTDKLTERLRVDLTTLQDNMHTQERKEQESLFKDLLKKQKYDEATAVAKGVIAKYPNSQAAAELTKLLPKVEDLIKQRQQQPATA